jgi:hypothetical protein
MNNLEETCEVSETLAGLEVALLIPQATKGA